jgi:hypothetical protein
MKLKRFLVVFLLIPQRSHTKRTDNHNVLVKVHHSELPYLFSTSARCQETPNLFDGVEVVAATVSEVKRDCTEFGLHAEEVPLTFDPVEV